MCLEIVLNWKLCFSLSLREGIAYICVLPWFFEGFHVQLALFFFFLQIFLIVKKRVFACSTNLSFLPLPPQGKLYGQ